MWFEFDILYSKVKRLQEYIFWSDTKALANKFRNVIVAIPK